MPCVYEESPEERERRERLSAVQAERKREKQRALKRELDLATRLLCEVCTRLERASTSFKLAGDLLEDQELAEWWKTHKAADERRRAREARKKQEAAEKRKAKRARKKARESALEKLTAEEREALGL
jgi:hypothetical protein